MEQNQSEYRVGIFVGLGLLLLLATILFLGGGKKVFSQTYNLKLKLSNVSGLAPGSGVQLSGLPIGNVSDIVLETGSTNLVVTLKIEKIHQSRITKGASGSLRTQGALGDKFIYITPGPVSAEMLGEDGWLETELDKDLLSAISQKGDEFQRIFEILKQTELLVTTLNLENRPATIMRNLVTSTEDLKTLTGQLNLLMTDIRGKDGDRIKKTVAGLEGIMTKLNGGEGTLGALINDNSLHEKLKEILGVSKRSKDMKNLIRETIKKSEEPTL